MRGHWHCSMVIAELIAKVVRHVPIGADAYARQTRSSMPNKGLLARSGSHDMEEVGGSSPSWPTVGPAEQVFTEFRLRRNVASWNALVGFESPLAHILPPEAAKRRVLALPKRRLLELAFGRIPSWLTGVLPVG